MSPEFVLATLKKIYIQFIIFVMAILGGGSKFSLLLPVYQVLAAGLVNLGFLMNLRQC